MSKEQINTEFDSLDSFSATSIQEWPLFEKILLLIYAVSIQEWNMIESGYKWRGYGI